MSNSVSIFDSNSIISNLKNFGPSSASNPTNLGSIVVNPDRTINIGNNPFDKNTLNNPYWNNSSKNLLQVDLNVIGNTQISGKLRCGGLNVQDVNTGSISLYLLSTVFGNYDAFVSHMNYPESGVNPNISINSTNGVNAVYNNKNATNFINIPLDTNIEPNTLLNFADPQNTLYKQNFIYPPLFPDPQNSNVQKYAFYIPITSSPNIFYLTNVDAAKDKSIKDNYDIAQIVTVQNPIDIASAGYMLSYLGFIVPSDKRIKKNIETYDTSSALSQIKSLRLTTYQKIDNSTKKEIGFIAQEVYEELPSSIEKMSNYIPNIYKWVSCSYDSKTQNISFENSFGFSFMNRIQIKDENDKKYSCIVIDVEESAVIHSTEFIENPPAIKDRIFIYGTYIEDFMSLNKEVIFSVAIGAIQELEKKVSDLTKRIEALEK